MIGKSSRKFRDDEVRRVEVMLESGRVAINLAREANQTALVTADRAEEAIEEAIVRIAKEMSRALLAESQKWLVLNTDGAQSARGVATGGMGRCGDCGCFHCRRRYDAMVECERERDVASRAGSGRPLLG